MPRSIFEHDLIAVGHLAEAFELGAAIVRTASNDSSGCAKWERGGEAWRGLLEQPSKMSEWGQEEELQEEKEGMDSKDVEHIVDIDDQWPDS